MVADRLHAIVPAAGIGARLGGDLPKQYSPLLDQPLLAHSLRLLLDHPAIAGVTVALAADDSWFESLFPHDRWPLTVVQGGATRAESVLNALDQICAGPSADWVLVHDAARPGLPRRCLDDLIDQGLGYSDGAILALPVCDTLKRADDGGMIVETLDRAGLWQAQTPQLFPAARLQAALRQALDSGIVPTDEAEAMERIGASPRLVQGDLVNLKVTWPEDLQRVTFLMQQTSEE